MGRSSSVSRAEVEELYRRYGALVRRRARSILNDEHEAEDAMQEVFVRAISSLSEFRRQSQPSTWLYRITTNLCLNRIRDGRRRRERLVQLAESPLRHKEDLPQGEVRATLRRILAGIPEDLAQVATYYYIDEMDQIEIAALLGVSRRTIGYRLDRFREEAQALLGGDVAVLPGSGVKKAEGGSG